MSPNHSDYLKLVIVIDFIFEKFKFKANILITEDTPTFSFER